MTIVTCCIARCFQWHFCYSLSHLAAGSKLAAGSDMAVLAGILAHHPVIVWQKN